MNRIESKINSLLKFKENVIIAIDGPCGSGKSTAGEILKQKYKANLFHMDDFFLSPSLRTEERLKQPGGNVDYDRFYEDVLKNVIEGIPFKYSPFRCDLGRLDKEIEVSSKKINIIEGVYSMHPKLFPFYDVKLFIKVSRDEQIRRIKNRDSSKLERFVNEWIPFEDRYFSYFNIEESCDYIIDGTTLIEI